MRILVVGAGATGGYFGGRLAQAGRDVTFLVRRTRAEQLRKNGLQIKSPHGDFTVNPKTIVADEITSPFDTVLLSVKGYALSQALDDMAPAVGPGTMVVPVLNGMRHIDALVARFGEAPILGGVCIVATMLDSDSRIVQLADMQELTYGERDGTLSPRIESLHAQFANAGFTARASQVILQEMWEKWVMLASLGGVTCLMRGNVGEIEAAPGGTAFALQFLAECASIATAFSHPPREAFLARASTMLTAKGSAFASSMYRDMQQNAPVEVDQILADLLHRAQQRDIPAPLLKIAVTHLTIYQNRLSTHR